MVTAAAVFSVFQGILSYECESATHVLRAGVRQWEGDRRRWQARRLTDILKDAGARHACYECLGVHECKYYTQAWAIIPRSGICSGPVTHSALGSHMGRHPALAGSNHQPPLH